MSEPLSAWTLKKIIIIAGPNGAGKTTFAQQFLPSEAKTYRFVNADLIALGLSPFDPELVSLKAARLMIQEINGYVDAGESFAFETTLSGLTYIRRIRHWKSLGYAIKLWFLALPTEEVAIARVAQRVLQGGHFVPESVIRRRFRSGYENFLRYYQHEVDSWAIFDSFARPPRLVDWSGT
jgi:predicted ABC-type ATPase